MSDLIPRTAGSVEEFTPAAPAAPSEFDPRRWIALLRRRLRLFLAVLILVMLAVLGYGLTRTPTYSSNASLVIDPKPKEVVTTSNKTEYNLPADTNAIDTDVQVISSRALAAAVIRKLNLDRDSEFAGGKARSGAAPAASASYIDGVAPDVIDAFQRNVGVRRAGLTYVVDVTANSKDPVKAANIANAVVDLYISQQLGARYAQGTQTTGALGAQLTQLKADVEASDRALQDYKIAHNLLSSQGSSLAEQEASALNTQIAAARAEAAEKIGRLNAAREQLRRGSGGADVGAALSSDTIRQLRSQEADTSRLLADLSTRYGDRHPEVLKAQSQLADIRRQIQSELNRIVSNLSAEVAVANQRVASLEGSYGRAEGTLGSNSAAQVGLNELQRKADADRGIYEAFLNGQKDAAAQQTVLQPDAHIVSRAEPALKPSSPKKTLVAALALAVGLIAGAAAVAMAELFSNGISAGSEVSRKLGAHYAGAVPLLKSTLKPGRRAGPPQDYIIDHPFSAFAESFRSLRTFLTVRGNGAAPQVIAITSALPKEGKSMTAVCLARTMALAGSNTVLIDCDLRRRGSSNLFAKSRAGLLEVLGGKAPLQQALVKDERSGAWVLPTLDAPQSPRDLFVGPEWEALVAELRRRFDVVLLDTAPVLAVADTRSIAAAADATLMLTAWRKTPVRAADSAIELLVESGANLVGVALTRVDLKEQSRAGYGDRYFWYGRYKNYYAD